MEIIDFVSGFISGCAQLAVGQPLDILKTKFQVAPVSQNKRTYMSFAKQIYQDHGAKGFYRGTSSLISGIGFQIAIEFFVYGWCKRFILQRRYPGTQEIPEEILSLWEIGLSGFAVGLFVPVVVCPIQYAKIIRQTQPRMKESSFMFLVKQIRNNRLSNIYKGLTATIMKQFTGSIVYFVVYEAIVRKMCEFQNKRRKYAEYYDFLVGGGCAGLSFVTVVHPIDLIKTRVQAGQTYTEALKDIMKSGYRGFGSAGTRAVLVNAVSFAVYEETKGLLSLAKQLSHI